MKIRRVWLKDVGPFKKLDLTIPQGTRPGLADVVVVTGPNGSGKTTLLYALGSVLGTSDQLGRRWSVTSEVAVEVDIEGEPHVFAAGGGYPQQQLLLSDDTEVSRPWHHPKFNGYGAVNGFRMHFAGKTAGSVWQNEARIGELALHAAPVFAYGTFRKVDRPPQQLVISEDRTNALSDAVSFDRSVQPGSFETWVANTRTKLALAREDSDVLAVRRYERSIQVIEGAVSDLVGEPFTLRVSREPLEVLGVVNGVDVPLNMLPDGLRSALAWLGDVLRRLDGLTGPVGADVLELPITVLLDEIDAHLHPAWQRRILHVAERLLPNAQLIVSTHSPFVIQSATDACVVMLGDHGSTPKVIDAQFGRTFDAILEDVLGVRESKYGIDVEAQLKDFKLLRDEVLRQQAPMERLEQAARELAQLSESLDLSLQTHLVDVRSRLGMS